MCQVHAIRTKPKLGTQSAAREDSSLHLLPTVFGVIPPRFQPQSLEVLLVVGHSPFWGCQNFPATLTQGRTPGGIRVLGEMSLDIDPASPASTAAAARRNQELQDHPAEKVQRGSVEHDIPPWFERRVKYGARDMCASHKNRGFSR